jgi:hypothetical protein
MRFIQTTQLPVVYRAAVAVICWLSLALLSPGTAMPGEPKPSTHRYIPSRDLIAYFEFDGLDAHAEAWKATAAHAMLAKTNAGTMLDEVARQWLDWWLPRDIFGPLSGADVLAVRDHLLSNGFALAIHVSADGDVMATLVLKGVGHKDLVDRFRPFRRFFFAANEQIDGLLAGPIRIRGREVYTMTDDETAPEPPDSRKDKGAPIPAREDDKSPTLKHAWFTVWFEGDDLIMIVHEHLDLKDSPSEPGSERALSDRPATHLNSVFDAIEGKLPNVTSNPRYLAALAGDKEIKKFEPVGIFFAGPIENKSVLTALCEMWPDDEQAKSPASLVPRKITTSLGGPTAKVDNEVRQTTLESSSPRRALPEDDVDLIEHGLAPVIAGENSRRARYPSLLERWREESVWAVVESDLFDELNGLVIRWGFQGKAWITDVRIEAPAPRRALSVALDQPALNKTHLPPLPRGINSFAVASFDPARTFQSFSDMMSAIGPRGSAEVRRIQTLVQDRMHLRLRDDLLTHVGPTWWTFQQPSRDVDRVGLELADPAAYVILTCVDDTEAFLKVLDSLASQFNDYVRNLEHEEHATPKDEKQPRSQVAAMESLPAPDRGYRLTAAGCRAVGLDDDIQPVIMVGNSLFAMAADVERAHDALARTSQEGTARVPSADLAKVLDDLPADLTFLAVADHRDSSSPERIASLPSILQFVSNVSLESDPDNASAQCLFDLVGIPRPGGLRLEIKPSQRPKFDDLRAQLFPSVVAGAVNERGYRLISREAFPMELVSNATSIKYEFGAGWTVPGGFRFSERVVLRVFGFDPSLWLD